MSSTKTIGIIGGGQLGHGKPFAGKGGGYRAAVVVADNRKDKFHNRYHAFPSRRLFFAPAV